jgi:hypothetical protein
MMALLSSSPIQKDPPLLGHPVNCRDFRNSTAMTMDPIVIAGLFRGSRETPKQHHDVSGE